MNIRTFALTAALLGATTLAGAQNAPGPLEIDGRKVLTLVSSDPPGLRCNNNIQVAAELANTYKVPILIYPVSFMPAGTKAPIVWFGGEIIAQSGGKLNGMISYTVLADRFEVEGVARQDKSGLLMTPAVNVSFEALKQSIKGRSQAPSATPLLVARKPPNPLIYFAKPAIFW